VYTSKEPDLKREQSDLALEILVLAHGWLMTEVQSAMQDIMIRPKMVDPFNLDHGKPFHILHLIIDPMNFMVLSF
jgi:sacsin